MWLMELRFFRAEYSGLIAAPGTPKAQTTPSFSRIRTAASIARIFAISHPAHLFCSDVIITTRKAELNEIEFVSHGTERIAKYPRYQMIRSFWK
jgi:hypothetical protein